MRLFILGRHLDKLPGELTTEIKYILNEIAIIIELADRHALKVTLAKDSTHTVDDVMIISTLSLPRSF